MKKILALITAASMFLCAVPQYAHSAVRWNHGAAGLDHVTTTPGPADGLLREAGLPTA